MSRGLDQRRPRKPTRRLDPTALRELVADGKIWVSLAKVIAGEDGQPFTIERDGGTPVDILIDLQLVPTGEEVTARVSNLAGGAGGRGIYGLPGIGQEYLVNLLDGSLEDVIAMIPMSSAALPASITEATSSNLLLVAPEIRATDALGGADALSTLADLQAQVSYMRKQMDAASGHTHLTTTPGNPSGPPIESAVTPFPPLSTVPSPAGTQVLKSK